FFKRTLFSRLNAGFFTIILRSFPGCQSFYPFVEASRSHCSTKEQCGGLWALLMAVSSSDCLSFYDWRVLFLHREIRHVYHYKTVKCARTSRVHQYQQA